MHRLLSYKGYVFPAVNREDAAVLNPAEGLRSAEQMEEEEREAQSAKLQELIRRGGPADLQEANKLMKVMAGYDTRNKTDWRAKAAEEVAQVQQKAKLLEDMLQNQQQGKTLEEGDVYEELANALMSAHPKIQKMCEEESDDHEAVHKLLEINDSIHRTIERYKLIKNGDVTAASKIPKGTLGTSGAGVTKGPNNELSLIDLGGSDDGSIVPQSTALATVSKSTGNALEDDLLGLSLDASSSFGGGISLGGANSFGAAPPNQNQLTNADITSLFNTSSTSQTPQAFSSPSQSLFGSATSPTQVKQPQTIQQVKQPAQKVDPFASITSSQASRTASPFQFQQSAPSTTTLTAKPSQPIQKPVTATKQTSLIDDEWDFASALPAAGPLTLNLTQSNISINWQISRESPNDVIIKQSISNNTANPISNLTFQIAVTKVCFYSLYPSGNSLD